MKHLFKFVILFLGIILITYSCQKDDTSKPVEDTQIESIKAYNLSRDEIPLNILDFVKTKTNNTFSVDISKRHIKLSDASYDGLASDVNQLQAESIAIFSNENTSNGLPSTAWDWEQFYFYYSM